MNWLIADMDMQEAMKNHDYYDFHEKGNIYTHLTRYTTHTNTHTHARNGENTI